MDLSWAETKTGGSDIQGSKEWLEWRKQGIGSSSIPVIMGLSPWKTLYELYQELIGEGKEFQGNWITERGKRMEGFARDLYEIETCEKFPPAIRVHPIYPWVRASLDGVNDFLKRVIEIKCPIGKDLQLAENGIIPDKYLPQIQWQLFVTGHSHADYIVCDGKKNIIIPVKADIVYQQQLFEAASDFWFNHVVPRIPPPCDFEQVNDTLFEAQCSEFYDLKQQIKNLEKIAEAMQEKIAERVKEKKTFVGNYLVQISERKGSIDYSQVKELEGVDLEKYRKPSTQSMSVKWKKDE